MNKLIIVGASGHGKVVADIARVIGYKDIVFLDDNSRIKCCDDFSVVGTTNDIKRINGDKIVAIGDSRTREKIQKEIETVSLIHPNSSIGYGVQIGKGTVIMAGAVINSDTIIGEGCIINTSSSVDHDCVVGDYSHISVGAHLCGNVKIGNNTWVGAGAVVINNIRICSGCTIGAGAVVIRDIDVPGTYIGVPARILNYNII